MWKKRKKKTERRSRKMPMVKTPHYIKETGILKHIPLSLYMIHPQKLHPICINFSEKYVPTSETGCSHSDKFCVLLHHLHRTAEWLVGKLNKSDVKAARSAFILLPLVVVFLSRWRSKHHSHYNSLLLTEFSEWSQIDIIYAPIK